MFMIKTYRDGRVFYYAGGGEDDDHVFSEDRSKAIPVGETIDDAREFIEDFQAMYGMRGFPERF
jgi:hypothetical protein